MKLVKNKPVIAFAEGSNDVVISAVKSTQSLIKPKLFSGQNALIESIKSVKNGESDAVVVGIDHTTRDVILAARDILGMKSTTFSSSFIMELTDASKIILADCATCKNPTAEQLAQITIQTVETAKKVLKIEPKVALLSFSSHGSGGKDLSIDKIRECLNIVKSHSPDLIIDGEIQLDAAINPDICAKKTPSSPLKGRANILITPDLNSGNILYKSIQQFAGAKAFGPILQGFNAPICDLSRGATAEDIIGIIKIMSSIVKLSAK